MATTDEPLDGITEHCECCERDTLHQVSIQMRTESTNDENAAFSREPYRVAECQQCNTRVSRRMNDQ